MRISKVESIMLRHYICSLISSEAELSMAIFCLTPLCKIVLGYCGGHTIVKTIINPNGYAIGQVFRS